MDYEDRIIDELWTMQAEVRDSIIGMGMLTGAFRILAQVPLHQRHCDLCWVTDYIAREADLDDSNSDLVAALEHIEAERLRHQHPPEYVRP